MQAVGTCCWDRLELLLRRLMSTSSRLVVLACVLGATVAQDAADPAAAAAAAAAVAVPAPEAPSATQAIISIVQVRGQRSPSPLFHIH